MVAADLKAIFSNQHAKNDISSVPINDAVDISIPP
jgi:hypothetical protein